MSGFVLDCSIAVSWCFEDEAAEATDALLERARDEGALVPSSGPAPARSRQRKADKRRGISGALGTEVWRALIGCRKPRTSGATARRLPRGPREGPCPAGYSQLLIDTNVVLDVYSSESRG